MNQQIILSIYCLNVDVFGPKIQLGCEDKLKTAVATHFEKISWLNFGPNKRILNFFFKVGFKDTLIFFLLSRHLTHFETQSV